MAGGGALPVTLALGRSAQSGSYTMAGVWQAVYSDSDTFPYIFYGGEIDLTNMAEGDLLRIRMRKRQTSGGAWRVMSQLPYIGLQPIGKKLVPVPALPDVYGFEVSMIQDLVAVAFISVTCDWFPAKRPGV